MEVDEASDFEPALPLDQLYNPDCVDFAANFYPNTYSQTWVAEREALRHYCRKDAEWYATFIDLLITNIRRREPIHRLRHHMFQLLQGNAHTQQHPANQQRA